MLCCVLAAKIFSQGTQWRFAVFSSTKDALKYIAEKDIAMVDLKIIGIAGQWLHITIPARQFTPWA